MSDSLWPVCGKCCEVSFFDWMGGSHFCVQSEVPDDDDGVVRPVRHASDVRRSRRIIIEQHELNDFWTTVQHLFSGDLGELEEIRVVASDGGLAFGANGYVTEEFGMIAN